MATTMPGMSRDARRSLLRSAARGAGLVGAAVILGIILLQVVDDGGSGPSSNGGGNGNGTTPADTTGDNGTTDTTPTGDTTPPAEVRVLVLNAGQATGSAGTLTNTLRAAGYNMLPAGDDPVARAGVAVACRAGFENDANALAFTVGQGATVEPTFPEDKPGAESADCVVLLGQV